jgi:hypothetical protein
VSKYSMFKVNIFDSFWETTKDFTLKFKVIKGT